MDTEKDRNIAYNILKALCESSLADELQYYFDAIQEDLNLPDDVMYRLYNLSTICDLLKPPEPLVRRFKGKIVERKRRIVCSLPFQEPVQEPVPEPVQKIVQEPVQDPAKEPAQEPVQEPVQKPAQEPVQEPVQKIVQEPVQKIVQEPIPEPAQEPAQEPMQEPAQEPAQEPMQEPVQKIVQEPVQEPVQKIVPEPAKEGVKKSSFQESQVDDVSDVEGIAGRCQEDIPDSQETQIVEPTYLEVLKKMFAELGVGDAYEIKDDSTKVVLFSVPAKFKKELKAKGAKWSTRFQMLYFDKEDLEA